MRSNILLALPVAALIAACGGSSTGAADMTTTTTPDMTTTVVPDPVKPALATTQIERMGRATINVAVTNPFDLDYTSVGGGTNRDATRDKHSKDGNEAQWAATWTPIIAKTLALYDGVDTKCGNQFGACGMAGGCAVGSTPMANRYNTLAGVFADDRLYLDSTKTDCSFYLAVEATVLQVPGANTFCGGRTPTVDVVDVMYTAATVGASGFPTPVKPTFDITDGIAKENETADSLTVFPFLSDPN